MKTLDKFKWIPYILKYYYEADFEHISTFYNERIYGSSWVSFFVCVFVNLKGKCDFEDK